MGVGVVRNMRGAMLRDVFGSANLNEKLRLLLAWVRRQHKTRAPLLIDPAI